MAHIRNTEPEFTIGIEEEYLLVDKSTRNLVDEQPPEMISECEKLIEGQVSPEFLRCQIEVGTQVHRTVKGARDDLSHLRRTIADRANQHGMAPIAVSTHPSAQWDAQKPTAKERYSIIAKDLQGVGRRLVICGMHVHVGLGDDNLRIDLMNQITYFLPHLLALSTSSPFWRGHDTGLKSYRLSIFNELPRTGLPERFDSFNEFQRNVAVLQKAGLIEDATKLWWDVRPSARFPTLEVRICDVSTRLEDAVCIAALYQCLLRMLYRLRRVNQRWRIYSPMLVNENRWRAQRYGVDEGMMDFGKGCVTPFPEVMDELLELIAEDAEALDCVSEVNHAREIVSRGTSAHRQVETFNTAISEGSDRETALQAVVDRLIDETVHGL